MNQKRRENDGHTSRFFGANPQKKIITFYRVLTDTTDTHVLFFESQADLNQKNFSFSFQDFCTVELIVSDSIVVLTKISQFEK